MAAPPGFLVPLRVPPAQLLSRKPGPDRRPRRPGSWLMPDTKEKVKVHVYYKLSRTPINGGN